MVTTEPVSLSEIESRAAAIPEVIAQCERSRQDGPVPAWVLPATSCNLLRDLAGLYPSPPIAFELGSGRSTPVLRNVSVETTTVEHSPEWLYRTEISAPGKRPADRSIVIPLRRCWSRLRLIESFDLESEPEAFAALQRSQLILVDSPPNPAKREHALFLALRYAPVGAMVVLDDLEIGAARRFSERLARQNRKIFRFWKANFDHQLGLFLKMKNATIRSSPTLREFVGTWLRA